MKKTIITGLIGLGFTFVSFISFTTVENKIQNERININIRNLNSNLKNYIEQNTEQHYTLNNNISAFRDSLRIFQRFNELKFYKIEKKQDKVIFYLRMQDSTIPLFTIE